MGIPKQSLCYETSFGSGLATTATAEVIDIAKMGLAMVVEYMQVKSRKRQLTVREAAGNWSGLVYLSALFLA